MSWLQEVKFVRVQTGRGAVEMYPDECHTVVEFVNGGRACSCGLLRGQIPSLRSRRDCVKCGEEVVAVRDPKPAHRFVHGSCVEEDAEIMELSLLWLASYGLAP